MRKVISLLFFIVINICSNGQIIINEFLAKNVTINPDNVDFDDYSDWLEIYNTQNVPVDLTGYFLTDNLNDPLKWEIPGGTIINAHGTILFWTDGYDSYPGRTYNREYSPWEEFETSRYHTNFKLNFLGEEIGLFRTGESRIENLIYTGAEWKYLDDGSDQDSLWKIPSYNDSDWEPGFAQLGYGDGDETTVVGFGGNSSNKFITTYFRKPFHIGDIDRIENLSISVMRDDGAVVYINGIEVVRSNMPDGDINYRTLAASSASGAGESQFFIYEVSADMLVTGTNVIAVEIHQIMSQSSDISFDLELKAIVKIDESKIELIDSVVYNRQIEDVSLGRNPEDNYKWYYYGIPTPGRINAAPATLNTDYSSVVIFSNPGGFYEGPQIITLSSAEPGEQIYYTINGETPTISSIRYEEPIRLTSTTVIRARTFGENKLPGTIKSQSFFINEAESDLPVVSLVVYTQTMWDSEIGIYTNILKGREVPLSLEYFPLEREEAFQVNAGVRIGGYNIWRFAQKPLNIYLDGSYDNDQINYKLFDKPIGVFTSFGLRNGGDNWSSTFITDAMTESLVNGQMNNGVQAYKPCVVYINGLYWGIHNIRERFDKQYLTSNFNADPNNIDQIRYNLFPPNSSLGLELIEGSMDGYNTLVDFVNSNDMSSTENYDFVQSQMDVDNFIDFIAAEVYVCNTSWRHNREWWRSTINGGKWHWFITDIDRGFNYSNIGNNILDNIYSEYLLFRNLLANSDFKNNFVQRFAAHLNSTFSPTRINNIVDSIRNGVSTEMPRHIQRWASEGGITSMINWNNQIDLIKKFADERVPIVFNQIKDELELGDRVKLSINFNSAGSNGTIYINGVPIKDELSDLAFFKNIPLKISLVPKPGYRFTGWLGLAATDTLIVSLNSDTTITAGIEKLGDFVLPPVINENFILNESNLNYTVEKDLTIADNFSLIIKEGVTIEMPKSGSIYVKGKLRIEGSKEKPVKIIQSQMGDNNKWGALCFDNSRDTNSISNLILTGASIGSDPINQKGAISCNNSIVVMDNLVIDDAVFPIYAQYGSVTLRNSRITATGTCDYIGVRSGEALIENNLFFGNKYPDTDGIDLDGDEGAIVRGNKFYNFHGLNCDAIDIGEQSSNILIKGNFIYNSSDKGISVGQHSTVNIEKNVIVSCNQGVAVKDESYVTINGNTLFMNNYAVACYEKNFGQGGGHAEVINSIFSASLYSSYLVDNLSSISVSNSLSDMDILPGSNNLFGDPMFIDLVHHNLQLNENSVCIDAGIENGEPDPDGTPNDIGAYYIFDEKDIPGTERESVISQVVINEIMYNSSTDQNNNDWIELYNNGNNNIDLSGWKLSDSDSLHIFEFPINTILNSRSFVVVCRNSDEFKNAYPGVGEVIGNFEFGLGEIDKVILRNTNDSLISFVAYSNVFPWADAGSISNHSLELNNPFSVNYRTVDWALSEDGGSPGRHNSKYDPTHGGDAEIPTEFSLYQNYPNPFNPSTRINYNVSQTTRIKISVYNVLGEEVENLVNEFKQPGFYTLTFSGNQLASAVYIVRMEAGKYIHSIKMVLLK